MSRHAILALLALVGMLLLAQTAVAREVDGMSDGRSMRMRADSLPVALPLPLQAGAPAKGAVDADGITWITPSTVVQPSTKGPVEMLSTTLWALPSR